MELSRYAIRAEHEGIPYVFSGMSGAFVRLSARESQVLDDIENGRAVTMDDVGDLLKLGVVADSPSSDLDALRRRRASAGADRTGLAVTIVSSIGCNFDCPYCFESKHPSLLKPAVADALFAHIETQLPILKLLQIHWIGGEPLMAKESLYSFSERIQDALVKYPDVVLSADITTNGYLLDVATAKRLKALGISKAQICIDGPPEVHDKMRPLASGRGTFYRVLSNVIRAVEHLDITIRVNADKVNISQATQVIDILKQCGLDGRVSVYLGKLTNVDDHAPEPSPSVNYVPACFTTEEYAQQEVEFLAYAAKMGFNKPAFPQPLALPCTAVRPNEMVIGSDGEVWKCWESIGNPNSSLGNLITADVDETRLGKWLQYDPIDNSECRDCVALPVCMGGCAHHAMSEGLYEHRCVSFRYNHVQRVHSFITESTATSNRRVSRVGQPLALVPVNKGTSQPSS